MKATKFRVQTCRYIDASDIFAGFGLAWDVFMGSNPDCTWGDNNRSLVTPDIIVSALNNCDVEDRNAERQVEQVIKMLNDIEPGVYVDLEN